jgi:glycerol-3-phosphate dehydrogenase (NAD(P)+)
VESLLESIPNDELKDKMLVSAIKGVLPDKQMTVSQYLRLYKEVPSEQIATITGPCHAEEVAQEKLSYLTFSSPRLEMAQQLGRFFHCHYVQPTCTTDAGGAEMGAVLKNVYALAAGMAHGLGYGDNFTAVLVANAAREMQAFLHTLDAHPSEVLETTYLGDLLVTAYSQFSRNRTFGAMVGRGYSVRSAQLEMGMVAEGYYAVGVVLALNEARKQVDMPICRAVHEVLYQQGDARSVFAGLARQLS